MTVLPRFTSTHHHGNSNGPLHHRVRHHPVVMYSSNGEGSTPNGMGHFSSSSSRSEVHQHHRVFPGPTTGASNGIHHSHSSSHNHYHHQGHSSQSPRVRPPPPPPSIHFHHHHPQPFTSINPTSALPRHSLPPPIIQPSSTSLPIRQKPPLKEKTPMCLINELVRFNKIKYQYRLTDESGPSHKRSFTVLLKLGPEDSDEYEEYAASGLSIKKAQHAAAALALEETKLKHPVLKAKPQISGSPLPTVELNTLAMKRREKIQYELIHPYHDPKCQRKDMRKNSRKALKNGDISLTNSKEGTIVDLRKYIVNLKVGEKVFTGEGGSLKVAKHAAANAALLCLRTAPVSSNKFELDPSSAPFVPGSPLSSKGSISESKSPISLVHENALKRNLSVTFRVESESGPMHMKTFVNKCTVGEFSTEGHGKSKKTSKKRAAELMLDRLKTLPPLANCSVSKRSSGNSKAHKRKLVASAKRRAKHLVKLQKTDDISSESSVHPVSRLIQIQQARKEKEPIYTLVEEKGRKRKLEFVMQVSVGELSATGSGANKKAAKRSAAENLLELMDRSASSGSTKGSNELTSAVSSDSSSAESHGNLIKNPSKSNNVPGILRLEHTSKIHEETEDLDKNGAPVHKQKNLNNEPSKSPIQKATDAFRKEGVNSVERLEEISKILQASVSYTDFQRKENNAPKSMEYMTLLCISHGKYSEAFHGSGTTPQESKEDAAGTTLKHLSKNGFKMSASSSQKD